MLEKRNSCDGLSIDLEDKDKQGNYHKTSLNISGDGDELSYAETCITHENGYKENCAIYWNHLGEIPKKLEGMNKNSLKALYDNLRNMAITIQSDEFGADFGNNNKFTYSLEEILRHIKRQLSQHAKNPAN